MSTNNVSPAKLRKVMETINLLIARADHPNTPAPEAELSRQRAERMMYQYRIDEASLDDTERARMGIRPVRREMRVYPLGNEFADYYRAMASYVMSHVDARAVSKYVHDEDGTTWLTFDVFAYESDLGYAEVLWNSIRLGFKSKLEPDVDPTLSDEENVYNMRNAGMERVRISEKMGWGGNEGNGPIKVTRIYKRACKARGEDGRDLLGKGNSMKAFRITYAESFQNTIWERMWKLRQARGQESHGLVLANRAEIIAEAMYEAYPHLRPVPAREVDDRPLTAKEKRARDRRLDRLMARAAREAAARPYSAAGAQRGAAAADSIDLGPVGGRKLQG